MELRDLLAPLGLQELQELLALRVRTLQLLVRLDLLDLLAPLELQGLQELKGLTLQ